jgi:hypothetical protein
MVISIASVALDNRAQLHTLEGFAAALLMVGTVYLVVSAVTLSVPQTELHVDAQLKAYGQDALNVLDTSLPPENNRSYYSSVLKNAVVGWMNGVEGATSFETDKFCRDPLCTGNYIWHTSHKFEFAGPPILTNEEFEVLIPNNTQISHAYITLTGMPLLNITAATTPPIKYKPKNPNDPSDQFGCAIAYGDLNNDTVSDLVVGAYGNNSSSGAVYVYYGRYHGNGSGITTWEGDGPNITIVNPGASGDQFGWAVACGDVDGDGVDDLIVGAPENGTTDTGAVYLYNGPILTDAPAPNVTIRNPRLKGGISNGRFGCSLACGDVNGDSCGDILVGAPTAREYVADCGNAFVYFGGAPFSGNKITLYNPYNSSDYFGISVASVDINGDGLSDIVIGANATNRTYIRYGGASLPSLINANNNEMNLTLYGESGSDFGISISPAGDVNNDGVCDLIVGASAKSSVHIFYGGSHLDNTSDINLTGESGSGFGISVSRAGDVDSDGYAGVIVGRSDGKVEVFYDVDLGVDPIEISGDPGFGSVVSYIGDVDNDGIPDVAVGAPGAGTVYAYTPKFPEEPWLAIGDVTDPNNMTKVWEYTTVIQTDNGNRTGYMPVSAGNSTGKNLSIYREITTDAILSMWVCTDSGNSADVRISVNGVEVNASSPAIDTGGNWTWHNITLPPDITEWKIGDNTIRIDVTATSDPLKIGMATGVKMIHIILPITQPFKTTERTSDFADAINNWMDTADEETYRFTDPITNETWWIIPFTLHSNSSGAIDATNLHVKAAPSLDEYLDMLLPDFVNYNVIFAFLDTLLKGHLYTFSDGSYEKTLNFTGNENLTVHIVLPENTTAVYKANMDVAGLPNASTGTEVLTLNFAHDADAAIVVDSEGYVHIGYSKNGPQMWYIHNEDWAWDDDTIAGGGGVNYALSMAIDSVDELHSAFLSGLDPEVYYSRTNDGVWLDKQDTQLVNDSSKNEPSHAPSQPCIAVDTANAPHTVWVENASVYYSNNTAGIWSPAVQVNNTTNATSPLLNIDSTNTKHLVFLENRTVYYMNTTAGNWSVPIRVDNSTNVSQVSRSSDHNDYLYLAWVENGTTLYYSNNTGGFWSQKDQVYSGTSVSDPSISTEYYSGISHIVWADADDIHYSNNAGGSWNTPPQLLGSDGQDPSIAVDAYGNIHVIWGEGKSLYYYGYVLNYPTKPYIVIHNRTVWNYNIEEINHNDASIDSIALGDSGTDAIYKEFDIDATVEGISHLSIYTKGADSSIDIYVKGKWIRSAFIPANATGFVWYNITLPPGVWDRGINELRINGSNINNTYGYANSTDGMNDWYCNNGTMYSLDHTWMIRLYATEYRGTQGTADFSETLTSYISSNNASDGNYNITFIVHSDTEGKIKLSRLRVYYYIRGNETQVVQKRIITNGVPPYNSVTATRLVTIQYTDIPDSIEARNYADAQIPDASMAPAPIIDLWNIVEVRLELWYK